MEHIIVEGLFSKPLDEEEEHRAAQEVDRRLDVQGGRWLRSYYSKDRKRCICEFLAPDVESVREAWEASGMPADQIWSAQVYTSESIAG